MRPILRAEQVEWRRQQRRARGGKTRIREVPASVWTSLVDFAAIAATSAWIDEFGSLRAFRHLEHLKMTTEVQKQELRAQIDEQRAVFERRLAELEHAARRREWMLATAVALAVGVGSILIAHFLFGF